MHQLQGGKTASNDKARLVWRCKRPPIAKTHGMKGMETSQEPQELWEPLGKVYKPPEGLENILSPQGFAVSGTPLTPSRLFLPPCPKEEICGSKIIKSASSRLLPTGATRCRHEPFCESDRIPAGIYLKQPRGGTAGRGCGGRGREGGCLVFVFTNEAP